MYVFDPENPDSEEISLDNGNKKIIIYHGTSGKSGLKLESACRTVEIYDSNGNLIIKITEKNPHKIY